MWQYVGLKDKKSPCGGSVEHFGYTDKSVKRFNSVTFLTHWLESTTGNKVTFKREMVSLNCKKGFD